MLAEFDPLVDEGRDYAARLAAAGIPVDLHAYPGMRSMNSCAWGTWWPMRLQARARIGLALAKAFRAAGERRPRDGNTARTRVSS